MKNFHLFKKKKSRISIVCVICAPRENKEAEINIIAASTRLNNSMARGARKPSAHNTYADWRGDGNTRKRRKQTEVPPCVRSPLLPCALFSRCKNVTSEWGGGKLPTCCLSTEPRPNIHTVESEGSAHHFLLPSLQRPGGLKKNKKKCCVKFRGVMRAFHSDRLTRGFLLVQCWVTSSCSPGYCLVAGSAMGAC